MEETTLDFDKWIQEHKPEELNYYAVYLDDGTVTGIYPERVVVDKENKILIDREIADRVREGATQLHRCRVNVLEKRFLVSYEKEIDDVLHRIPNKQWSSEKYFDFYIEYHEQEQKLVLALSTKYFGTRDSGSTSLIPIANSNTEIQLIFTDYNDPNIPYYNILIKIADLMSSEKEFTNIILPDRFSVFTRRFFDTYVVDIK